MINLGDYKKGDTIYFHFTTRNSSGVPTTPSGMTISIYEDDSVTQTTAAITTTTAFDSVAGLNSIKVDTSNAAYTTGKDYSVVVTAGTVGGVSVVGEVVARFTLDRMAGATRSALGLATANLDTQLAKLDTIDDFLDTEIAAIKAKTDNLPADPADASDIAASFTTVNTKLDTIDDFLDTEVAAIKAKTDNLPADPADASDIAASFTATNALITTVDTVVDAIKVKTDNLPANTATELTAIQTKTNALPADPADASDIAASFTATNALITTVDTVVDDIKIKTDNLPANTATEISAIRTKTDNLPANTATVLTDLPINFWNFDFLANIGTVVNRFSGWNAMRHILCKWSISGTTKTVHKEGTVSPATAYTTTLTLDGDGEITGDTP